MNVYKKLQQARTDFLNADIKKSGKNKFAGYEYFELGDFIPAINQIFNKIGLIGVVRFATDIATLTVYDADGELCIEFTSPMVFASSAKGQAIQDLGSTHTYMRRYLWLMAMEIVEHDAVDSSEPAESVKPPKAAPKEAAKPAKIISTEDNKLFVAKLIEWAVVQDNEKELVSAWMANQKQIDVLKKDDPELYTHLRDCFTEIKSKFKKEQ
jgi:hypothetical protein